MGLITYANGEHRGIAQSDRGERQLARINEMLAVTQAEGAIPIAEVLAAETTNLNRNTTVIIITPSMNTDWVAATRNLINRGVKATGVLIDASSFDGSGSTIETEIELTASHIPHYVVRCGDQLDKALANVRSTS